MSLIPLLKCVICGVETIKKYPSQVTCLKEKCRKECHNKWYRKDQVYIKNCKSCGTEFKTNLKQKIYCCKECSVKIRKIRTKLNSTHWARKKNGTYDKYVRILREQGYTVLEPRLK